MDEPTKNTNMDSTVIGVEWVIAGGKPTVNVQIRLDAPGITLSTVPSVGPLAILSLEVQAAHDLGRLLSEKAEAAARKAGVIIENKLGHEKT